MRSKLITFAVGLCIGSFYSSSVIAAPFVWNSPVGGAFDDPANWTPMMVPGITDDATFELPAIYTVTFPTIGETGPLNVSGGDVTFSLAGTSYAVDGNVDIGGSLVVDTGTLSATASINVTSGGTLSGSGMVISEGLVISLGGRLSGSLSAILNVPGGGSAVNSGTVAPGNGSGTITIDGAYQQNLSGLLEIEIGGLTAGSQHDQLLLLSTGASLAGRLKVPFISSYAPAIGHEITFLQSGNVTGTFDSISLPDYQSAPVAVQVNYLPIGASLSFVAPTAASTAPMTPTGLWGSPTTWTGSVPITSDVVDMVNSDPSPSRVDLDVGSQGSQRAFAHEVNISSQNPAAPSTLGVPTATSLSAISRVSVGENGIVDLSGGAVITNLVQVDGGGELLGNGTIAGDVVLGTGLAIGEATLSPGSSGSAEGVFNAENLTINSDGVLAVAIDDVSSFGRVAVEQTTTQGGRLVIDATNYVAPLGTQFTIMTSGTIDGSFDSVETVGSSTVFFAQPPIPPVGALGGENYNVESYSIGDMNLDNSVDSADAPDFVLGLLDPLQYWATHGFMFPVQAGNFHPGSSFDFDDIEGFTDAVEGLVAADIFALIDQMSVPEPTTGGLLLLASGLLGATRSRRLNGSVGRSG